MTITITSIGTAAAQLTAAGCLNPVDRAIDLARSGRCRFYRRSTDGQSDVYVEATLNV